ncbi:hypothetical protein GCM10023321_79700 [Pseudonocardia eucalypti]|uniref:Uncharacterized protein n=1 Tax=Pseudonocardia eucalypti TaxID=648755 RepID=A0ABP9RC24_9PSEU|nr:hypothetical protein [Pseudonocardia eucalypti]
MADGARNGRDAGASGGSGDRGGSTPRWQPSYYGGPPTHADVPSPKRAPAVETDPGRTKAVRSSATAKAAAGKARPAATAAKPARTTKAAEVEEPAGQRSLGKVGALVAALLLLLGLTGGLVAAFRAWYTSPAPVAQSPTSAVAPEINQNPAIATPGAPIPDAAPPAVPAPRQGTAPAKPKVAPASRPDRGHQAPAKPEHQVTKDRPESRSERDDEDDEGTGRDEEDILDQQLHKQRRASDSGGLLDGVLSSLGL